MGGSEFGGIWITGLAIMFLQKFLKSRLWYGQFVKLFPGADKWAHRAIAAVLSFIGAVGIHWTFDGSLVAGGTAHIVIPSLQALAHGAYEFFGAFGTQQFMYASTQQNAYVNPTGAAPKV